VYDITIIVINSAMLQTADFFKQFSLVVLDEVHMYCSAKRKEIFKKISAAHCVLAMSATTEDRNDKADIIAHRELAPDGIIRAENIPGFEYSDDVNFVCQAVVVNYYGPNEYTQHLIHPSTNMLFTHYMHNQFISDPTRLGVAIDHLIELYHWRGENGQMHNIYVFAEELDILKIAKESFEQRLKDAGEAEMAADIDIPELGMFTGGIGVADMTNMISTSRILFTTYGYGGQGVSILKMTAILLLTPRKSGMKQIFARILRRGSDITIPRIIIDIQDVKTGLRNQLNHRKVAYDYYGFDIKYKKMVV
jgi:predicted SAM-dependent methyltransferase